MACNIEDDLVFRRFDASRQEQIKQLVSYVTLLGLGADDLISIGNRLKRIKVSSETKHNKILIKDLQKKIKYVNYSFYKLQFVYDTKYECEFLHWPDQVRVTNRSNKEYKHFTLFQYNVGGGIKGRVGLFLVNIKNGDIKLDF